VDTIPGVRIIRIILLVGAIFFGISAFALMIFPEGFIELLGLEVSEALVWAMMLIAVTPDSTNRQHGYGQYFCISVRSPRSWLDDDACCIRAGCIFLTYPNRIQLVQP